MKAKTTEIRLSPEEARLLGQVRFSQEGDLYIARIEAGMSKDDVGVIARLLGRMKASWVRAMAGYVFAAGYNPFEICKRLDEGVLIIKKDGFFGTPRSRAEYLVRQALPDGITPEMLPILEPSAGTGGIATVAAEMLQIAPADVHVCESAPERLRILADQGFTPVGDDFIKLPSDNRYRVILMNPPFENSLDAAHVLKAMKHLAPGGILAAIVSYGVRENDADEYGRLRALADRIEDDPPGAFRESGTMIKTCTLVFRRPEGMQDEDIDAAVPQPIVKKESKMRVEYEPPEVILAQIAQNMSEFAVHMNEIANILGVSGGMEGLSRWLEKDDAQPAAPQPATPKVSRTKRKSPRTVNSGQLALFG
jgi:hypothetical protein